MKKVLLSLAICLLAMNVGFAQNEDDMVSQPTHVVGKRINASGEVTKTLESSFSYNEEGKVVAFGFPEYSVSSAYVYIDDYLRQEGTDHSGGYPEFMEFLEYTYNEEGSISHLRHEWSAMHATQDWNYTYDEYGRLKQRDFKDGTPEYHQHYIYDYEDEGKTRIESFWTSWELEGLKLKRKTVIHYDDNFNPNTIYTETYDLEGNITGTTLVTYTYTPSGKEESQVKQILTEGEWVNTSIQHYAYDEYDRVIEQQNGTWSAENDDWNIDRRITFEYEPTEEGYNYIVSFYKESGEGWVWDVFDGQTILFESLLKIQQRTLRYYVYEEMNGSGNINQFEFTFSNTPEPVYLDIEEKEDLICTVYPNPTNGMVTITGKDLKSAEVVNMMGERVLSIEGEGDELKIDVGILPIGIYFVNITDNEGHKCVRKVVKK